MSDVQPNILFLMADQTGGSYHQGFNRFGDAMARVLERTSVTYVLAIQPDNLRRDGAFHRLKVKLKKDLKGARLIHRPGYFAPRPPGEMAPLEKRLNIAGLVIGGHEGGAIRTAVLAAPYDVESERAHVPVLIEIEGSSLLRGTSAGVAPAEIYVYGIDRHGSVADYFTRALGRIATALSKLTSGDLDLLDPTGYRDGRGRSVAESIGIHLWHVGYHRGCVAQLSMLLGVDLQALSKR